MCRAHERATTCSSPGCRQWPTSPGPLQQGRRGERWTDALSAAHITPLTLPFPAAGLAAGRGSATPDLEVECPGARKAGSQLPCGWERTRQAGQGAAFARKWQQRCDTHLFTSDLGSEEGRGAPRLYRERCGAYTASRSQKGVWGSWTE